MKTAISIALLALLTACGGGDYQPECVEWVHVMPAQGNNARAEVVCVRYADE